jgi:transposase
MGQRRNYDKEFKLEVVKLVKEGKRSAASVANDLGIAKSTVSKWVKELEKHDKNAFPGKGHLRFEDEEIRKLKRKIADLEEENAILKKAAAIVCHEETP